MLPLEHHFRYHPPLTLTKLKPFSRANSRVSLPHIDNSFHRFNPNPCRFRCPISSNDSLRFGLRVGHRASWVCRSTGEPDSAADSGEKKTGSSSSDEDADSNRRKGGWWSRWRRWRWQPLIQAQEIGVLLMQIGIAFFVMRLLRPGIPLPGSDPRSSTVFIALFYAAVLAGLLHRFPVSFSQHTAGQIWNRKSGPSAGTKSSEQGETITFADIAGVDEAKEELEEIVEFLRNPDRYVRLGARPPRGVLLVGLPGTGKTLLAKAVAGEADVPFISCSASEFVELYVGMGASRVRDLFARAKREAPSIIFIDEIDAVAKSRDGKFRIVSNDEREQTLNQLLTEMDGFDSNSAVIVLGATNRSDVLDPALRRPGRFDRVVMVEAPDRIGREAILKVHVSKKELPLAKNVDLSDIACMTTGFTGADLANLVNEAALLAGRQNKVVVEKLDFVQAVERSIAGIEKKTAKLRGSEKAVVARHEAGHAVVGTAVAKLLPGQPRVEKLSILPRSGGALGFTYIPPTTEDRYLLFVDELHGRLVTLLGGRAAEEVVFSGRVSTGALDDIRQATDMAYKAIAEYGLNQTIGPVSIATLSSGGIDDSGGAAVPWGRDQGHLVDLVQKEVQTLLQSALAIALSIIRANPAVLDGLGADLEEKEKVEGEELQKWLRLVVAPTELATFVKGTQPPLLPSQTGS
ncbi:ATP-dependent zinc metalloprotease FTSH 9, chloroplastic isoform B [Glycine soja]|uniref:ATP-dependent zinc metalloprotease FTSH 9, chloroplastic isoform B n=1 Tax=Glycine soja TaxID=3848 RepID=A0A445EYU7_GLYSO|nr:ATP-dependent zinc metalloprotease FTSH 9, chloroplastic isoform B [Glycine soja]